MIVFFICVAGSITLAIAAIALAAALDARATAEAAFEFVNQTDAYSYDLFESANDVFGDHEQRLGLLETSSDADVLGGFGI
jgi:hypothetical protein